MENIELRIALLRKGMSYADIGRTLNASRQLVYYAIHSNPKRGIAKKVREKIQNLIK